MLRQPALAALRRGPCCSARPGPSASARGSAQTLGSTQRRRADPNVRCASCVNSTVATLCGSFPAPWAHHDRTGPLHRQEGQSRHGFAGRRVGSRKAINQSVRWPAPLFSALPLRSARQAAPEGRTARRLMLRCASAAAECGILLFPIFWPQRTVLPNPSLNRTRYGRRRLAAPGHRGYCPCAARRRLPQRAG